MNISEAYDLVGSLECDDGGAIGALFKHIWDFT